MAEGRAKGSGKPSSCRQQPGSTGLLREKIRAIGEDTTCRQNCLTELLKAPSLNIQPRSKHFWCGKSAHFSPVSKDDSFPSKNDRRVEVGRGWWKQPSPGALLKAGSAGVACPPV